MNDILIISGIFLNNVARGVVITVGRRAALLLQTVADTFVDVALRKVHGRIILRVEDVVVVVVRVLQKASLASDWLFSSHPGL